jgi:hypothetical protein
VYFLRLELEEGVLSASYLHQNVACSLYSALSGDMFTFEKFPPNLFAVVVHTRKTGNRTMNLSAIGVHCRLPSSLFILLLRLAGINLLSSSLK